MPTDAPPEVLIVEDDPNFVVRVSSAVLLWQPAARITHCATGEEAVVRLPPRHQPADLALVDLGLPDMDGCNVIAALRSRSARTPILVVSILNSEQSLVAAIRSGASGYIIKDGSDRSIAESIAEVMAGNYPLSPALARHLFRLLSGSRNQSVVALTSREIDTLRCIGRGLTYEQAATDMGISLSTVQSHVRNLYRKLEINNKIQAAMKAHDLGLF